jgi:hypothetical protein
MHNAKLVPAHCVVFVANSENRTVEEQAPPQWSSIDTESKQEKNQARSLADNEESTRKTEQTYARENVIRGGDIRAE